MNSGAGICRAVRLAAIAAITVAAACAGTAARAASYEDFDFAAVVHHAEQIFVGTVDRKEARRDARGVIVTDVIFADVEPLYGVAPVNGELALEVFGGDLGDVHAEIAGEPPLVMGQRYLMFAFASGKYYTPIVGGTQGIYVVKPDPASGAQMVYNAFGHVMVREPLARHMERNTARPSASSMPDGANAGQAAASASNASSASLETVRAVVREQLRAQGKQGATP